jgi:heat shock protein HslJ
MDNVNQQEQRFLQVLSNVDHYQIDNNTLILSNENNSETITAIRR